MMKSPMITTGVAAIVALALPVSASAHSKPSTDSVRSHVRSADAALTKVEKLVATDKDAAAAIQMVLNLRQTKQAARDADRVRGAKNRASAQRRVAEQYNDNVETYAEIVDEVEGDVQVDVAQAVSSGVSGRERALGKLTELAGKLPAQAQRGIARAISALSSGGTDEVADLAEAAQSGNISADAQPHVDRALAKATSAIGIGMERLQGIVAMLPPQAQGHVQQAIDRVNGILQGIFGGGTPSAGPGSSLPIPSNLPIPSGLPIPSNLPIPSGLPIPSKLPIPSGLPIPGFGGGR